MANWIGSARTNYVRLAPGVSIEDLEKLFELLEVDVEIWTETKGEGEAQEVLVGFGAGRTSDDGAFPGFLNFNLDEDDEDIPELMKLFGFEDKDDFLAATYINELEFEWDKLIMPRVAVGEVLVVQTVGAEKLRYLTGRATAFIRRESGQVEIVSIGIDDIYDKARERFGLAEDFKISAAEY